MSPERFELHNFDVLLNGLEIKAHVYRLFFTPPQISDRAVLQRLSTPRPSRLPGPLGGLYPLKTSEGNWRKYAQPSARQPSFRCIRLSLSRTRTHTMAGTQHASSQKLASVNFWHSTAIDLAGEH